MRTKPNRLLRPPRFPALILGGALLACLGPFPALALTWETLSTAQGLPSNRVLCVAETRDHLFAGTDQGLAVIRKKDQVVQVPQGLPHSQVLALLADGDGVWIGTGRGLARWQDGKLDADNAPPLAARVTSLLKLEQELLLGTDQGVLAYHPARRAYRPLEGLPARPVSALAAGGPGVVVGLGDGTVLAYDPAARAAEKLDIPFNPLRGKIKSLAGAGDLLWFVIDGAGVVQYHQTANTWSELSRTSATGKFLSGLAPDGRQLWITSFYGLHRYDHPTQTWEEYTDPALTDHELLGLAVYGEWVTVGTDGGGLARGNKRLPHIGVEPGRRLFGNEPASFQGQAQGAPPLRVRLQYCLRAFPDTWFDRFSSLSLQGDRFTGSIDFRRLADNPYTVRVVVTDAAGATNAAHFTWIKDTQPLSLSFQERPWWPGVNTVEGRFENFGMLEIILSPGGVRADLDPIKRTFRAALTLAPEDQEITADALDAGGRRRRFTLPIVVSPAAVLDLASDTVSFLPGAGQAALTLSGGVPDPVDWELRIENQDGILLRNYAGRGTLPVIQVWDGRDNQGEWVDGGFHYYCRGAVRLPGGQELTSPPARIQAQLQVTTVKKGKVIKLAGAVLYEPGNAEINPGYLYIFDEVSRILSSYPGAQISIEGHTDSLKIKTDRHPSNLQLSEERALIVRDHLIRHCGLAPERLSVKGFGAARPAASNRTEKGRAQNRRVEILILE